MNEPKLSKVMAYIDEDLITGAIEYMPKKAKRPVWVKWAAMAACLCLVVTSVFVIYPHYSDEANNNPSSIHGDTYKVEEFAVVEVTEPIALFTHSFVPSEEIINRVTLSYPNVDCTNAIYIFSYSKDATDNYWFPVMDNGKIVDIVFATFNSKGDVITGHSESHADELNAIAQLTSKDEPLYIVADEFFNYYIIGDTAYVTSAISGIENEYIGDFVIPEKDPVTVTITSEPYLIRKTYTGEIVELPENENTVTISYEGGVDNHVTFLLDENTAPFGFNLIIGKEVVIETEYMTDSEQPYPAITIKQGK